ncbi:uncharacterized protein ARMOST_10535 [Armillaria ostoyae]|uniref:Uncharacterized protein n=1 Tax=Armillaria ostoyae TaxID=47428 RepID=A0A284REK5_ARMOS|nr:uncharacterized protein ARMOST_10535 [Armillaria ostoyae]
MCTRTAQDTVHEGSLSFVKQAASSTPVIGSSTFFLVELHNLLDASRGPEYIWIAVKVTICRPSRPTHSQSKQYVDAVTPERFFKDYTGMNIDRRYWEGMVEGIPEPNVCPEGGMYNVLRVLAGFPEQFQDVHRMDDDLDGHPLVTLRMDRLKVPSQSANPEQFVETMETWLNQDNGHSP